MRTKGCFITMMVFLAFGIVLSSCKKEPIEYHEFIATFNADSFVAEGETTEVIFTNKTVYSVFHRSLATRSEQMYIFQVPYVSTETTLSFSDVEVVFSKVCPVDSINYNGSCIYSAVAGELVVQPISNGIIQGSFNFVMVNKKDDTDTVRIENGKFKVTYSTIWVSI